MLYVAKAVYNENSTFLNTIITSSLKSFLTTILHLEETLRNRTLLGSYILQSYAHKADVIIYFVFFTVG